MATSQQTLVTLALTGPLRRKEDRRLQRVSLSLPVEYSPGKGPNAGRFTESQTLDVSAGGTRFFIVHSFNRGFLVNVSFNVGSGTARTRLLLPARVVQSTPGPKTARLRPAWSSSTLPPTTGTCSSG